MVVRKQISFDPNASLAKENAVFAVELAAMAYKAKPEIEAQLDDLGFKNEKVAFIRCRLYSCVIIRFKDVTVIAFKGTDNWREHLNNLNVWPEPTSHGRVHAGFLYTMKRVGPLLNTLIHADILSKRRILLTGHSRGGALAQIFASLLVLKGHPPHSVWAFGSPMVGDMTFASLLKDVPVSIFSNGDDNGSDPVVLFPPNVRPKSALTKWLFKFKAVYISVVLMRYFGIVVSNHLSYLIRRALERGTKNG
jgi:hypothetical protein